MPNPFPDAIISYTVKPAVDRLIDLGDLPEATRCPAIVAGRYPLFGYRKGREKPSISRVWRWIAFQSKSEDSDIRTS